MNRFFSRKGKGRQQGTIRRARLGEERTGEAFRRSRNLSGSLSDNVDSANAKRAELQSDRIKLHRLRTKQRWLRTGVLLSIIAAAGCVFLLSHSLALTTLKLPGRAAPGHARQALREALSDYVNSHPAQAFTVSFDEAQAASYLLRHTHPEIAAIEVTVNWLDGSDTVYFRYRDPVAVWRVDGKTYYVDTHGIVFRRYEGAKPRLRIHDTTGYIAQLSQQDRIASERFISYIGRLVGELRDIGVAPVQRVVIPPKLRQLHIYIKGHDYPIKVNTSRDPSAQARDIKHALQFFSKKGITPDKYVDVRVAGKAYFK